LNFELILINKETEKNRKNEMKLFQQDNLLHIAEMFRNIAHHWRQPLSIITTNLSGINLKLEYKQISEEEIKKGGYKTYRSGNQLREDIEK